MKKLLLALVALLIGSAITATSAIAGPATDALVTCLSDNTTGKDRKDLAEWIFVGMSVHPQIRNLSNITEADREQIDRKLAGIVTRLITQECRDETKAAVEKEGGNAPLQIAFGVVGKLAMQELMADPEVKSSFSRFGKYIEVDKIKSAFADK